MRQAAGLVVETVEVNDREEDDMKTIMVDGREVAVEEQMPGQQISEMARCSDDQFAVVVRNNGGLTERIPIQKSRRMYPLHDGDTIASMYRVPNGG